MNNSVNNSMNNIIQDNSILSNSTNNSMNNSMNNTLINSSNSTEFGLFENGIPLTEFDNSNNSANTSNNQNLLASPNRNVNVNRNVNTNVRFSDPMNSLNSISDNMNTTMSNNVSNNSNNINTILSNGLLETSTNNSTEDLENYFYIDDNRNSVNMNLNSVSADNVNSSSLLDVNINKDVNANGTKVSDNFELEFPARMSDGRQFTDYKSNGFLNLHEQELKTTLEYRLYLQNNAEKIMDNNYSVTASVNECSDCPGYQIVDTKSLLTCNKESCIEELKNESGLGYDIKYVAA